MDKFIKLKGKDLDLVVRMRRIYEVLRKQTKTQWDRDLPFEELLFDRWERAKELGFGEGSSIYHNSYVYGKVKIGKKTWVGPLVLLDGSSGLEIGDFCSISSGVQIYTHDTVEWAISGGKLEYKKAPTKIGNCCYIGPQSVIAKGVTIGDHCIIGACSFVNHDIPRNSIAVGIPCEVIGEVEIKGDEIKRKYYGGIKA